MNSLVVLRPVRDPAGFSVNRKSQKIFINREAFILNPADRNALEAALAGPHAHVTALALGGEPALEALRMARAAGASRAICIPDPEAAALDPLGVTTVIEYVITRLGGIDLVLLGADVLDSDAGQVGPRLAAALDWPYVDHAFQATTLAGGGLGLVVPAARGFQLIGVELPAVAGIARDGNKPRLAPAAQIITVFSDPQAVETMTLADLGLDPAQLAPTTVARGESFPLERTLGRLAEGEDAARRFADALRKA